MSQRALAIAVVGDGAVLAQAAHEIADAVSEALAHLGERGAPVGDDVVQDACGHDVVAAAQRAQETADAPCVIDALPRPPTAIVGIRKERLGIADDDAIGHGQASPRPRFESR